MNIMKIAFDIQPLLHNNKSGVGYHEDGLITEMMRACPEDEFILECFTWKNREDKLKTAELYRSQQAATMRQVMTGQQSAQKTHSGNIVLDECRKFPGTLYRMIFPFIPVPYRLFFQKKAEVTHFFNFCVPPGVSGKTVVTVHDMAFRAYPETIRKRTMLLLKLNLKRSLKRADRIVAVSEFTKREIEKFYHIKSSKISVISNGVDEKVFHPRYSATEISAVKSKYGICQRYFLYLGNLEPRKNIVRLLEAYALFFEYETAKGHGSSSPLFVIAGGKGWLYQEIFLKVKELGLTNKVIFTGYVEEGEVPILMCGADVFVFPSLYEGFGMPLLEAMACGTPVITSDSTALKEIAEDACVLVDPMNIQAIKEGMKRIYQDQKLREVCVKKGLKRARQFTWERSAKGLYDIYRELAGYKIG